MMQLWEFRAVSAADAIVDDEHRALLDGVFVLSLLRLGSSSAFDKAAAMFMSIELAVDTANHRAKYYASEMN